MRRLRRGCEGEGGGEGETAAKGKGAQWEGAREEGRLGGRERIGRARGRKEGSGVESA